MAKQTSFIYQRDVLEQFSFLLQNLAGEMKSLSEKYKVDVLSLYEELGLMEEIYMDYKSAYMSSIGENLESIVTKINEEHIPFVEREIDFISSRQ